MTKISIVSPCFNEEDNVRACSEAVRSIFEEHLSGYEYEHIFTDNASTDATVEQLRELANSNKRVKLILNARNYGPFRSTFNALKSVTGDAVLVMLPVDLQDPPELIPVFVKHWEGGAKIVYGQRVQRKESLVLRTMRRIYYRIVELFADISIPVDTAEFQLIDKQVLQALVKSQDSYPYIRGMIANCGFSNETIKVPYVWQERRSGKSKNRLYNLFDQGMNGIISFTNLPLRISTIVGSGIAAISLIYALVQLVINLLLPEPITQPGIPTLIVAIFFFSGVQLFFIGLLGEYIGAIHSQLRRGSDIVEKEKVNFSK